MLHDIDNYSSTFIHLWPVWTTLTIRSNMPAVIAAFPGHFDAFMPEGGPLSFAALFRLGLQPYGAWWVAFTAWMLLWGRHQSPEKTKTGKKLPPACFTCARAQLTNAPLALLSIACMLASPHRSLADTVYLSLMKSTAALQSLCGIKPSDDVAEAAAGLRPVLTYMALHAAAVATSIAFSAMCLTHPPGFVHGPFAVAALASAIWKGAAR